MSRPYRIWPDTDGYDPADKVGDVVAITRHGWPSLARIAIQEADGARILVGLGAGR